MKLHDLYKCSEFLNAKTEQSKQAQVYTLYTVREICRLSDFGTVQHTEFMKRFKLPVSNMQEEGKLLSYVPEKRRLEHMETMRMNLLRSTALNSEIVLNMVNDNHILPKLLKLLCRLDPGIAQKVDDSLSHQK